MTSRRDDLRDNPRDAVLVASTENHNLPAWARVWVWCLAHVDRQGHARLYPGQLGQALGGASTSTVSKAIAQARDRGVLDPCSTASCLVLPGQALAPCEAQHREGA